MRITATMNLVNRTAPLFLALTGADCSTIGQADPLIKRVLTDLGLDLKEHVLNETALKEALGSEGVPENVFAAMEYLLESCEFKDGDFDELADAFSSTCVEVLRAIMGTKQNAEYTAALDGCVDFESAEKVIEQFADQLREPLLIAHADLRRKTGLSPQAIIALIPVGLPELHSALTQFAIIERVVLGDSTLNAKQVQGVQAFFVDTLAPKNHLEIPQEIFELMTKDSQPTFIKYI